MSDAGQEWAQLTSDMADCNRVLLAVVQETGHTIEDLRAKRRTPRTLVVARQWAMYRLREAGATLGEIALFMERDHTTIIHGIKQTKKRLGVK